MSDTESIASGTMFIPETPLEAPPVEKRLPKQPRKGVYTLVEGDTPGEVSIALYGDTARAVELVVLNPDIDWFPGDVIQLP